MTWSPTWWPSVSLTALKWSRSISITAPEARRVLEQRAQPALEAAPVEQLGERVVLGLVAQLDLQAAPLRDVDDLRQQRPVAEPREVHLRPAGIAVGGEQADLRPGRDAGRAERAGHQRVRALAVGGVHEVGRGARDQLLRPMTGDRAQRRVDAVEDAAARGEALAHGRGLERVREARLAGRHAAAGAVRVLQDDGERRQQRPDARGRAARSAARGAARRPRLRTSGRRRPRASARRLRARCPVTRAPPRRWSRAARRCGAARAGRRRPARRPGTRRRRRR